MSATLTAGLINQGLTYSAVAAVVVGVPPEVALGSLAGGGNICYLSSRVSNQAQAFAVTSQFYLRSSLL